MGILNVTPDSFFDGGRYADVDRAAERAARLEAEGADVIDIGGESTRPGAAPTPPETEAERVVPVIRRIRSAVGALISVDTRRASVARAALDAGADIVNDVSALGDPGMAQAVRDAGAGLVLMHMRGEPATMQDDPRYDDVVAEVRQYLVDRMRLAFEAGLAPEAVAIDPGIGFGKTTEHNLALMAGLPAITRLGRPVVVGVSRKRVVGDLTGRPVSERLPGSLALAVWLAGRGAAVIRTHDVRDTCDALRVADRMRAEESRHAVRVE